MQPIGEHEEIKGFASQKLNVPFDRLNLPYINSRCAGMISNPRFILGRKVKSRGQQIIRAIFIFLTPPSTVNSQQSTVNKHSRATGIDISY